MAKLEFINLAQAETMSETKLRVEIGKRNKYLKEQLGMDAFEAADLVGSLLNLGVAMNEKFKEQKALKNNN